MVLDVTHEPYIEAALFSLTLDHCLFKIIANRGKIIENKDNQEVSHSFMCVKIGFVPLWCIQSPITFPWWTLMHQCFARENRPSWLILRWVMLGKNRHDHHLGSPIRKWPVLVLPPGAHLRALIIH